MELLQVAVAGVALLGVVESLDEAGVGCAACMCVPALRLLAQWIACPCVCCTEPVATAAAAPAAAAVRVLYELVEMQLTSGLAVAACGSAVCHKTAAIIVTASAAVSRDVASYMCVVGLDGAPRSKACCLCLLALPEAVCEH